jgi:hypothetical protein
MGNLVLVASHWPLGDAARAVGKVVAGRLSARAVRYGARPSLELYDMVVVVASTLELLDPAFVAFAAERGLTGKTLALVTDAPPALGAWLFGPWCLAVEKGTGARWWAEPLHLGPWGLPGGLLAATPGTLAAAEAWASRLAEVYPAPTYPRGEPGRRRTDA